MPNKSMQFQFGDRELVMSARNILETSVDAIVNSANGDLLHIAGLAAQIQQQAGKELKHESELLIQQYGKIDPGMVVYTTAGNLPHKAVIHAVGPRVGEGAEQQKIEQVVARCLQLCEINDWNSVAFPAIGLGQAGIPVEMCAQGIFRSITHFWDARHECNIDKIELCLTERNFREFFDAFREDAIITDVLEDEVPPEKGEELVGHIELSDSDVADSDEFSDWFCTEKGSDTTPRDSE